MNADTGKKIVDVAQKQIGSHYLNGAYGAIPDRGDGCPCRPAGITLIADPKRLDPTFKQDPKTNLAVFAAEMTVKKYCVCAGNFATFLGGRPASPSDIDLINYLDSLRDKPPAAWQNYFTHFTPRRVFGPGPGGDLGGKLVWGQSCKGIRHFDCVGFISYCYWQATGKIAQHEISGWRAVPNPMGATVYDLSANKRPTALMDADILVQADHHIGFVSAAGTIIEAQDTHLGVRSSSGFSLNSPGNWTHLVRLPSVTATSPMPAWLPGWWVVTWRGQTYYYYFDRNHKVKWTPNAPTNTSQPPTSARDTGSVVIEGVAALIIRWSSTGSVENFGLLPSTTNSLEMGGTWNGTERIDAEKM